MEQALLAFQNGRFSHERPFIISNIKESDVEKYTSAELADKIQEATRRAGGEVSNDPRAMQAWSEHKRELEQQLWGLQHGRSDPP